MKGNNIGCLLCYSSKFSIDLTFFNKNLRERISFAEIIYCELGTASLPIYVLGFCFAISKSEDILETFPPD